MRLSLMTLASGAMMLAGDSGCPIYPRQERLALQRRLETERAGAAWSTVAKKRGSEPRAATARVNFIDEHVFGRMEADGIEPAPPTDDAAFLRRVMLDLTGRIPAPDQIEQFLADTSADKRSRLVDTLIGSPNYVDYWTLYFGNRFQVTSAYYQLVGIPGRNLFHRYLRDFVSDDRSFADLATELITATGDTHRLAPGNFLMRGMQQGDPIQDTWDTLTNTVTTEFLGVQTQCVSCHDGRRHLEEINLYLVQKRREDFMGLAAFFARLSITEVNVDAFNQQRRGVITDLSTGVYHGIVNPNNPGSRPARIGAYEPVYMFTGDRAAAGNWRREFARLIVNDRQFARATVNYLWAHFFRVGIVDPPAGWDLSRIDAKNPPPAPWTLQPSNPELLEALADELIRNRFRLRPVIRLMAQSAAYQLSSRYAGQWNPAWSRYFARHVPRRLTAEEAYDALTAATMTETPMYVEGFDEPLLYAGQFPDPSEPRSSPGVLSFLTTLGRGDWWRTPRTSEGSVVQALFLMNDGTVNQRTFGNRNNSAATRVARLMASSASDDDVIRQLFLATIGRPPTDAEKATVNRHKRQNREDWLTDMQWSLVNKAEFLFNH